MVAHLHRLQGYRREAGTDGQPFGVLTGLKTPPDLDTFKRLRDEGVTAIINVPWYYSEGPTSSLDHKRDTLNSFAERFIEPLRNDLRPPPPLRRGPMAGDLLVRGGSLVDGTGAAAASRRRARSRRRSSSRWARRSAR